MKRLGECAVTTGGTQRRQCWVVRGDPLLALQEVFDRRSLRRVGQPRASEHSAKGARVREVHQGFRVPDFVCVNDGAKEAGEVTGIARQDVHEPTTLGERRPAHMHRTGPGIQRAKVGR